MSHPAISRTLLLLYTAPKQCPGCWLVGPVRGDKIGGNPIHTGADGGCQRHQRRPRVKTWCQKKPVICSLIKADPWSLICKGAITNNRVWEAWEARPSFPLATAANIKYYHPQLPGHGKYPASHPSYGLGWTVWPVGLASPIW